MYFKNNFKVKKGLLKRVSIVELNKLSIADNIFPSRNVHPFDQFFTSVPTIALLSRHLWHIFLTVGQQMKNHVCLSITSFKWKKGALQKDPRVPKLTVFRVMPTPGPPQKKRRSYFYPFIQHKIVVHRKYSEFKLIFFTNC